MVKIEEGKFYRTRDGSRLGPAQRNTDENIQVRADFPWIIDGQSYTEFGRYFSSGRESDWDIIAEDLAEPTMPQILDGIRRALEVDNEATMVIVDNTAWVRQPAPKPAPELPRWQSHKIVQADKIAIWKDGDETTMATWTLECGLRLAVNIDRRARVPDDVYMRGGGVGGYYVKYADGYESWSPAKAFEEGYAKLPYGNHVLDRQHDGRMAIGDGIACACGVTDEQLLDGLARLDCPQHPFKA